MDASDLLQNLLFDNVFLAIVPFSWMMYWKSTQYTVHIRYTFSGDLYNTDPKQERKTRFYIRKQFPITYELCVLPALHQTI